MKLEAKVDALADFVNCSIEFNPDYSEKEKEAIRKKYNLQDFTSEEIELMRTLQAMTQQLQREKGTRYLTAEDDKELRRQFQAWLIEREQSKEKVQ
jgi:hypothetical protein